MTTQEKQRKFMQQYKPIHERFERFCRARVYGEMDHGDLMNETLLLAFQKFESLYDEKAFLSFLFSIAVRVLANAHRKKKPEAASPYIEQSQAVSSDQADRRTEVNMLYETMALLPEVQRECLILFEISGFSIEEIADIQDSGISAVKQRLRRGRMQLASLLQEKQNKKGAATYG